MTGQCKAYHSQKKNMWGLICNIIREAREEKVWHRCKQFASLCLCLAFVLSSVHLLLCMLACLRYAFYMNRFWRSFLSSYLAYLCILCGVVLAKAFEFWKIFNFRPDLEVKVPDEYIFFHKKYNGFSFLLINLILGNIDRWCLHVSSSCPFWYSITNFLWLFNPFLRGSMRKPFLWTNLAEKKREK